MTEQELWYWLCNIEGVGNKRIHCLIEQFLHPENVFRAEKKELLMVKGITENVASSIINSRNLNKVQENYAKLIEKGIYFLNQTQTEYPERLKHIYNPPYGLYYRGNMPEQEKLAIAIVGARSCTNYGREVANYFARELAKKGVQIISGLARGIDSFAHRGAMEAEKGTFGVLGCGIDICYPAEHIELYMEMQKQGGILSEYGIGVIAKPGYFPMRNRIISGLSDGILLVEAKEKSGSLITIELGLEQGKDIFVIPGRIEDSCSKGCNRLIQMGGELVESPEDILENYQIKMETKCKDFKKKNNLLEKKEKIVYACVSLMPKHINEITGETKLQMAEVVEVLMILEQKGYIKQVVKNYYVVNSN